MSSLLEQSFLKYQGLWKRRAIALYNLSSWEGKKKSYGNSTYKGLRQLKMSRNVSIRSPYLGDSRWGADPGFQSPHLHGWAGSLFTEFWRAGLSRLFFLLTTQRFCTKKKQSLGEGSETVKTKPLRTLLQNSVWQSSEALTIIKYHSS